jgi:site-specific DNA recombinase
MTSTNGYAPRGAILYARVSTDEQARSGYSLAQQIEALRKHAASEGYEVLEEVTDPGQSGASLERPGMDRVRDLVADGGVSVVLAQDRDRFAREPAYHYLLRKEFEEHETKIHALNDRGDDSPEGELTDGILDQLAKYERVKLAERSRRGKMRKAREGHVGVATPKYGFRYNEARTYLIIHRPEMEVVEKVFRMAAEGLGVRSIQTRLRREGIPSPKGGEAWDTRVLRQMVASDIYRPQTREELARLVAPEVVARLDPSKEYGICWLNRQKTNLRTVSESDGNGGRRYRKRKTTKVREREEWIAVPVPACLPRALVDQARTTMDNNKGAERKYLAREWELRGLVRCSCGSKMGTHTTQPRGARVYHYYKCRRRSPLGRSGLCKQGALRATEAEPVVWSFVSGLLKDPDRIRAGMERLIDEERANGYGDPERESRAWVEKLAECDRLRKAYQQQQAAGLMTLEELGTMLKELEETRRVVEAELKHVEARRGRVEALENDRDDLLEHVAGLVPEALDKLTGQERNRLYRMLRLEITPSPEGYEVRGAFCPLELPPSKTPTATTSSSTSPPRAKRPTAPSARATEHKLDRGLREARYGQRIKGTRASINGRTNPYEPFFHARSPRSFARNYVNSDNLRFDEVLAG